MISALTQLFFVAVFLLVPAAVIVAMIAILRRNQRL